MLSQRPPKQYLEEAGGRKDQTFAEQHVALENACMHRVWTRRTRGPPKAELQQDPNACQPEIQARISAPILCCCCAKTPEPRRYQDPLVVFRYSSQQAKGDEKL